MLYLSMPNTDTRKLSPAAREQLRRVVVKLYESGHTRSQISKDLNLRLTTVGHWVARYKESGKEGLAELGRGRPLGNGRKLTPAQEARIQADIVDKTPDQLRLKFALWSAQAVRLLIKQYFGVVLPDRTVRKYLRRWGFTPQRPVKRAYEQQPKAVQKWLDEDYPVIAAQAKAEGAQIHWGDETGISSVEHHPRGYAPKGKTPVLVLSQSKRKRVNLISSVTNQGLVRFMTFDGSFTAQVMIRFLRRLIRDSKAKIYMVLDNLRVHHSKKVKQWLQDKVDQIELFFLPSYAPELNPDEYFNADLKGRINAGEPVRGEKHMKSKVISHLRSIQAQPDRVRSYFKANNIKYAA